MVLREATLTWSLNENHHYTFALSIETFWKFLKLTRFMPLVFVPPEHIRKSEVFAAFLEVFFSDQFLATLIAL